MDEAEIRRLTKRLETAQVADDVELPDDMVFLGSIVKLKDLDTDDEDLYKLVGEATGNFDADEIEVTVSSPLGDALLKSRVGETVKADLPRGPKRFRDCRAAVTQGPRHGQPPGRPSDSPGHRGGMGEWASEIEAGGGTPVKRMNQSESPLCPELTMTRPCP